MPQSEKATAKKTAAKKTAATPPVDGPIVDDATAPATGPIVEGATAPEITEETNATLLEFKQTGPRYNLKMLDSLISSGRGDLSRHRDAIDDAVQSADNRSDAIGQFKEDYEQKHVLNMPLLNEAVNNGQVTARDLRGQLWKTIKALPQS